MNDILIKLSEYMAYPFVRYALLSGILIALCSSLLGVTLVLKRFSYIGDGLSHVAFGAMAIATVLNISQNMLVVMPITIIFAILLLRVGKRSKIHGDSAIAMVSVGTIAIGYLLMNIFSTSPNISGDVCSSLFGSVSILTLSKGDVIICAIASAAVILLYTLLYNKIFLVTFDEDFATAIGIKSQMYNMIIAIIAAIVIVLAMNLVGSLLTSALVIFPALSSMRIFKSFKSVIIFSGIFSVLAAGLGIIASILLSTPVGATIVVVEMLLFGICYISGRH